MIADVEPHAGKGERRPVTFAQAENVAIESDCAIEVLYVNEDLADARQSRADWYWVSHDFAPLPDLSGFRIPRLLTYYQHPSGKETF